MDEEDELFGLDEAGNACSIKCKPLNIPLNRLDLSDHGIIIKSSNSIQNQSVPNPSNNEEDSLDDWKTEDAEDFGNDAEETIKKIREFIALGRYEDSKKDPESNNKLDQQKPARLLQNKDLYVKTVPKVRKLDSSEVSKVNRELERTLSGVDSPSDSDKVGLVNSSNIPRHFNDLGNDQHFQNSSLAIPSRVSKRIQSKSVKFSAKKLLRGDDLNVLKRMIPGYDDEAPSKKERPVIRNLKPDLKKVSIASSPSPEVEQNSELNVDESSAVLNRESEPHQSNDEVTISEEVKPVDPPPSSSEEMQKLKMPNSSPEQSSANQLPEEKSASLVEKLGMFTVSSGKITLELKGTTEKKVVRIAIPPAKPVTPSPQTSLGPDIIIKRVKPVKKTIVIPENVKPTPKNVIEKEIEEHRPPVVSTSKVLKLPHTIVERVPVPKVKGNHILLPRNILRRGRPRKVVNTESHNVEKTPSPKLSSNGLEHEVDQQSIDVDALALRDKPTESIKETVQDKPSLTQQIAEALESRVSVLEGSTTLSNEEIAQRKGVRGRKPSKGMPLSLGKTKLASMPRRVGRPRKTELVDKSPSSSEAEEENEESDVDNLFEKYFRAGDRYIEHHDSLDSDSSDDYNNEIFSHFINLRRYTTNKNEQDKREDVTMFDLMSSVSTELPSWNIHVSSNGEIFYLAQIDASEDKPIMKKVIEIDLQYNTKVFVNGNILPEYEGKFSSYEDIKQLVYDIDQL